MMRYAWSEKPLEEEKDAMVSSPHDDVSAIALAADRAHTVRSKPLYIALNPLALLVFSTILERHVSKDTSARVFVAF